jgi:hypothetical protein
MLPFQIVMSKNGDRRVENELGLGPLDARSLALSVLLGSHPPVLPARALVALAELFGIAGGTMRTALSRMVAAGELEAADGRYRLAGRLLERQRAQAGVTRLEILAAPDELAGSVGGELLNTKA